MEALQFIVQSKHTHTQPQHSSGFGFGVTVKRVPRVSLLGNGVWWNMSELVVKGRFCIIRDSEVVKSYSQKWNLIYHLDMRLTFTPVFKNQTPFFSLGGLQLKELDVTDGKQTEAALIFTGINNAAVCSGPCTRIWTLSLLSKHEAGVDFR